MSESTTAGAQPGLPQDDPLLGVNRLWSAPTADWERQTSPLDIPQQIASAVKHSLDATGYSPDEPLGAKIADWATVPARLAGNALLAPIEAFDKGMRIPYSSDPDDPSWAQRNSLAGQVILGSGAAGALGEVPSGALRVFGGPNAATADLGKLAQAKAMALGGHTPEEAEEFAGLTSQLGSNPSPLHDTSAPPIFNQMMDRWWDLKDKSLSASPEDIHAQTGWFQDVDGKWKFEIPDTGSSMKGLEPITEKSSTLPLMKSGTIGDYVDHPDLYKAYPFLENMPMRAAWMNPGGGAYLGAEDGIRLGSGTPENMRSVAVHEINHAIQDHEGFATGGNTNEFLPARFQDQYKLQQDARNWYVDRMREAGANPYNVDAALGKLSQGIDPRPFEMDHLQKVLAHQGSDFISAYQDVNNQYQEMAKQKNDAYNKYKSLAGEVSSRNAEARLALGPLAPGFPLEGTPPAVSQIIRFGPPGLPGDSTGLGYGAGGASPYSFIPVDHNPFQQ